MALYKIIHKEELIGWFYVEANNKKEALAKYEAMVNNGEVDYSDMEMVDSSDEAVREEEQKGVKHERPD